MSLVHLGALAIISVAAATPTPAQPPPRRQTELGIVPLAGGDTDNGFGVGAIANVARTDPNLEPYRWNLESAAFIAYKLGDGASGSARSPSYTDVYLLLTAPHLLNGKLRLELRAAYTKESAQAYYGIGNASVAPDDTVPQRDFYTRIHPQVYARARMRGPASLFFELGAFYTWNDLIVGSSTRLWADQRAADPVLRKLVRNEGAHGVALAEAALMFDTRDSQLTPTAGQFHTLRLRASPSVGVGMPYAYVQVAAIARAFTTLWPERLVLAGRLVYDQLFGDMPFYELTRYSEETFAIGGNKGVRGVPANRYLGAVKTFASAELRATVGTWTMRGKPFTLGVVAFTDVGRLWAGVDATGVSDGSGPGLKYGAGGGLRLIQGRTFVVRADVAWSPDARPIAGYVTAGHSF